MIVSKKYRECASEDCNNSFEAKRSNKKYCSDTCRAKNNMKFLRERRNHLEKVMNADCIMDEGDRIRSIGTLMSFLDDIPMVAEVVCIKGVIAEVKFHLDRQYTYHVTQKGLDELEKSNG
tara:strand:- start:558 stop:917 length:360 start_codon:yes stop_codon:yes gene_type:complete